MSHSWDPRNYMHTRTHMHTQTYTYVHTYMDKYIYVHTNSYTCTKTYTHTHACNAYTCAYTLMHMHMRTHSYCQIHTYFHTCIHTFKLFQIHKHTYTCAHIHIRTHAQIHTHIFIHKLYPLFSLSPWQNTWEEAISEQRGLFGLTVWEIQSTMLGRLVAGAWNTSQQSGSTVQTGKGLFPPQWATLPVRLCLPKVPQPSKTSANFWGLSVQTHGCRGPT